MKVPIYVPQELIEVFETLDHQSYMLTKYKEGKKSTDENSFLSTNSNGKIETSNENVGTKSVAQLNKINETDSPLKPPGIDEEDESDEDLSYLL